MIEEPSIKIRIFTALNNANVEMDYKSSSVESTEYYMYLFNMLNDNNSVRRKIDSFFTLMFRLDNSVFNLFSQSTKYLGIQFEAYDDSHEFGRFLGLTN